MSEKQYNVSAGGKPDMFMTPDEVKRIAMELNSAVLYNCVMMYETRQCSWAQAMQVAALHLARETIRQCDELGRLYSRMPPKPIIMQAP